MDHPDIQYTRTGDLFIAYQTVGAGPLDLVIVPGIISNLEYAWEMPELVAFYQRLTETSRLILFDKRGMGLSDRAAGIRPLEERMDDLTAVLDALGSERVVLFGAGDGGAMAALFAASYPERTSALILWAAAPRMAWAPDYPWGLKPNDARAYIAAAEHLLERDAFRAIAERFAPTTAADEGALRRSLTYARLSVSPGAWRDFRQMIVEIDVRQVLPVIRVPTLVLHRDGDRVLDPEVSRYVARTIPGARYVELDGVDNVPWVGDAEPVAREIGSFLTALDTTPDDGEDTDRVLATVLFTDIVGSTARAAEIGDREWRTLLERHNALLRAQLARFRGRELDSAGDGVFAVFDGPARAIRCARSITDTVRELGLEVRAGLHTGEVEMANGSVRGIAVHIGARVAARAGPGEVLVSRTVRDLVAGSGLDFETRGAAELKGVPGEWELFAVRP